MNNQYRNIIQEDLEKAAFDLDSFVSSKEYKKKHFAITKVKGDLLKKLLKDPATRFNALKCIIDINN